MSYSPTLGRWVQQDPAGYVDGMSLYEAVRSSPATMVDPGGLAAGSVFSPVHGTMVITEDGTVGWGPIGGGIRQASGGTTTQPTTRPDAELQAWRDGTWYIQRDPPGWGKQHQSVLWGYWGGIRAFFIVGPHDTLVAATCGNFAEKALSTYGHGKSAEEKDALKHCMWSACIHRNLTKNDANQVLDIREYYGRYGINSCDSAMDMHNNNVGERFAGSKNWNKDCVKALEEGKLITSPKDAKKRGLCPKDC